jgi:hypothetical protein
MNSPPPLATSMSNIIAFIMKKAEVTNNLFVYSGRFDGGPAGS